MRARRDRSRPASLSLTRLEDRTVPASWLPQGPFSATGGQVENIGANPVAGAVHALAPHPTDANILYAGSVNGGVWKTTTAQAANPVWTPLTDAQSSLSVSDLDIDPTDATGNTVVAAVGRVSNFSALGGPLTGLLRTTDGGTTWTPVGVAELGGRNLSAVEAQGSVVLAAANNFGGGTNGGLYRSADGGASFTLVSGTNGLPAGAVFHMAADPTNANRFYVTVAGTGVYRTDDLGATWVAASADATVTARFGAGGNNNAELAVGPTGRVFLGVINNGQPNYIGYSSDQGATWTQTDLPVTLETNGQFEGLSPDARPGGDGALHFSIAADPLDPNVFYVGGQRQDGPFTNAVGAAAATGRLFRGDVSVAPINPGSPTTAFSPQWDHLTHDFNVGFNGGGTINGSAPHAGSRDMAFDATGRLVEADDGGVYVRTFPAGNFGSWSSLIGSGAGALAVTEAHDVAYDTVSNTIITGNQDVGTTFQPTAGAAVWNTIATGSGGDVAVDTTTYLGFAPGFSLRFTSSRNLVNFRATFYSNTGVFSGSFIPTLVVTGSGGQTLSAVDTIPAIAPLTLNAVNPIRGLLATDTQLYESNDQYDNLTDITAGTGRITAMVYGGESGGFANTGVIYYADDAAGGTIYLRTTLAGTFAALANYNGGVVTDIALNPLDWREAVVTDADGRVWRTTDAGTAWTDITANLPLGSARTVAYIPSGFGLGNTIVVGGAGGVVASPATSAGGWFAFGTALPNVTVTDFDYDPAGDRLVASTLGRGVWTLDAASTELISAGGTLIPFGPLGWQAYQGTFAGAIDAIGETDSYTLDLEAGAVLTVAADQMSSLRATVRLVGPTGTVLLTNSAGGIGQAVYTAPFTVPVPGRYTLQITSTGSSLGDYRLRAFAGVVVEEESQDETLVNDNFFGFAENLNTLFTEQGVGTGLTGVNVLGVVGGTRPPTGGFFPPPPTDSDDTFTFQAQANQPVTIGLADLSGLGGLTLTVTAGGAPVTPSVVLTPTNFTTGLTFTPTLTRTYTVQVSAGFGPTVATEYLLSVIRNGSMDAEANDVAGTSATVPLNGNVRGAVGFGDVDWYTVTVGTATTLTLATVTPGDAPNEPNNSLDPRVEIYDANGTTLRGGDDTTDNAAGDGRNSLLTVALPVGTYRIRVLPSPLGALPTFGSYVLKMSTVDVPPIGVSAGGFYTVVEGNSVTLSASATDDPGTLTYAWDINGDNNFTDATGANPTLTWAQLVALGITDGPSVFFPRVRASDAASTVTSPATQLTVVNGPPTSDFYVGPTGTDTTLTVPEGTTGLVVRLVNATDPSPDDVTAGLLYSFDLNNDGDFADPGDVLNGTSPTLTLPDDYLDDGNSTRTVRAAVTDKDGGVSADYFVTITVTNVDPTATGITGSLFENDPTSTVTITGPSDASAADRAALLYSFDLNDDGDFDDLGEVLNGTSPTITVPASLIPEGPGTLTVRARVTDKDGGFVNLGPVTLDVQNGGPTATLTSGGGVDEGSAGSITLTNVSDRSAADTAAGFTYFFDFDNDGTFDDSITTPVVGSTLSRAVPASFLDDGGAVPTTVTIRVRVVDQNGGFVTPDLFTTIAVSNVAPTGTLSGGTATVGSPLAVSVINPFDPSTADSAPNALRYSFDFNNDGDYVDAGDVQNSANPNATFVFQSPGTKTVRARVTDKDGASTEFTQTFTIDNVQPTASLLAPGSVNEGGAANVGVIASHPSTESTNAGFRYAYDFDGDGAFDFPANATDYNSASTLNSVAIPAAFLADGARVLNVRVRVYETFGLSTDATATVTVQNVAPTATLTGPAGTTTVGQAATFTFSNATDPSAADRDAGFRYSLDLNNDGDFSDPGEVADSTTTSVTATFATAGAKTVRGRITDKDGGFTDVLLPVTVSTPVKVAFAAGVDAGNLPRVNLYGAGARLVTQTQIFDPSMTAGVRVATADVNADGVPDLIAGTGPGVPSEIRVLDGATGRLLLSTRPFEDTFVGGVFVAAGDIDGDGRAEIVVSPDMGGGPRVVVYRGLNFLQTISFLGIDDKDFRGGARVGLADITGDGRADLLVAAGFDGGPRVAGYEGTQLMLGNPTKLFNDFFAFDPGLRNGVFLTGGDVNGDGFADLVVGAGPGGGPAVTVYDGSALVGGKVSALATFFAGDDSRRGGVRVAVADVDGDGLADVVTGEAGGPRANIFLGADLKRDGRPGDDLELTPFSTPMNGVFVG